jgi:hypothetical protein
MGRGPFPGVKRPGRGVNQRLPSSAKDKERTQGAFIRDYRGNCTFTVGDLVRHLRTFWIFMFLYSYFYLASKLDN